MEKPKKPKKPVMKYKNYQCKVLLEQSKKPEIPNIVEPIIEVEKNAAINEIWVSFSGFK